MCVRAWKSTHIYMYIFLRMAMFVCVVCRCCTNPLGFLENLATNEASEGQKQLLRVFALFLHFLFSFSLVFSFFPRSSLCLYTYVHKRAKRHPAFASSHSSSSPPPDLPDRTFPLLLTHQPDPSSSPTAFFSLSVHPQVAPHLHVSSNSPPRPIFLPLFTIPKHRLIMSACFFHPFITAVRSALDIHLHHLTRRRSAAMTASSRQLSPTLAAKSLSKPRYLPFRSVVTTLHLPPTSFRQKQRKIWWFSLACIIFLFEFFLFSVAGG